MKPNTHEVMTPGQAKQMIDEERMERARMCLAQIQAALDAHRCQLMAAPQITPDGRIVAVVQVVAGE